MTELTEKDLKKYETPQMNVVEICTQFELLCGSQNGDTCVDPTEESQNG